MLLHGLIMYTTLISVFELNINYIYIYSNDISKTDLIKVYFYFFKVTKLLNIETIYQVCKY